MVTLSGEESLENLFTHLFDGIYKRINESGLTIAEQRAYIEEQLNNLNSFLGYINLDIFSNLPLNLSISQILNYIKDPKAFLTILSTLVRGINFTEYVYEVRDFYTNTWNKYVDGKKTLQTDLNLILPLVTNIDTDVFKSVFQDIINNLDFNAMLNPDIEGSLYQVALKNNNTDDLPALKSLFTKLNGGTTESPYSNISEAMNEFIEIWDIGAFLSLLTLC